MAMEVLQNRQQIDTARKEMVARDISAMPGNFERKSKELIRRARLGDPLILGDFVKSWDVLATVCFLEERLQPADPILDIGCYASEVVVSLHKAGFSNLTGVDLNPRLGRMPHADEIKYVKSDFMETPFEDNSFQAVTSISVIEHGFNGPKLLKEMARILKPGGSFIASFDYWPDKIDTGNTRFFGMDWLIFSKDDVRDLIDEAAKHGLYPVGEMQFAGQDKAIEHAGYHYTFGWLALEKRV